MFATRSIIVAVAALAGIGTASAEPKPPVTSIAAPTQSGDSASVQGDKQRYCFVETLTSSRIARRVCRTKQEWTDMGVTLPSKY